MTVKEYIKQLDQTKQQLSKLPENTEMNISLGGDNFAWDFSISGKVDFTEDEKIVFYLDEKSYCEILDYGSYQDFLDEIANNNLSIEDLSAEDKEKIFRLYNSLLYNNSLYNTAINNTIREAIAAVAPKILQEEDNQ